MSLLELKRNITKSERMFRVNNHDKLSSIQNMRERDEILAIKNKLNYVNEICTLFSSSMDFVKYSRIDWSGTEDKTDNKCLYITPSDKTWFARVFSYKVISEYAKIFMQKIPYDIATWEIESCGILSITDRSIDKDMQSTLKQLVDTKGCFHKYYGFVDNTCWSYGDIASTALMMFGNE